MLFAREIAAADDVVFAGEDAGDGFAISDVLLLKDAGGESVGVVSGKDGDGFLEEDDAVVELLVDEVDGASNDVDAVVEGLLLGVEAREGRQQRRMDVQNAVGEGLNEFTREQAHVSSEADEIDVMLVEAGDDFGVMLSALASAGLDGDGIEAERAGGVETGCVGLVGDDDGDLAAGEFAGVDVFGDGEEVGAASGEKNAEAFHRIHLNGS